MLTVKGEDLYNSLEDLEGSESIIINVPQEVVSKLQLLALQKTSYENLFRSYVNNTVDEANKFNLEKFLLKYTDICVEDFNAQRDYMLSTIGMECYTLISNPSKYRYWIDFNFNKLFINKVGPFRMNNGAQ